MSRSDEGPDPNESPPTNYELSHRVARMEQSVEYVRESVDRIEDDISSNQQEIINEVDEMADKVDRIWTAYVFLRWFVPIMAGGGGTVAAWRLLL